jgi:hypothetical protein
MGAEKPSKTKGFSPCGNFERTRPHSLQKNQVLYQGTTLVVP